MDKDNNLALKIAFATSSQSHLDQHFGSCESLAIYQLTPSESEQLQSVAFAACEGHNQQKINARLAALKECFAVYCLACGNPVRQQLLAQGIRVVIKPEIEPIDELLQQIQANWPGKIASRQQRASNRQQDRDYFKNLADSEWDEEI